MFHINVWLTANNPADAPRIRRLLGECASGSRLEPGCLQFDAFQSETDPTRFLLVECWESKLHWETHRQAATAQTIYLPLVLPLVTRDAHPSSLIE